MNTYFIDIGGELSLHNEIKGIINRDKVERLQHLLDNLTLCLMDRGMKHVDTWVEEEDEKGIKFAEIFGFRETGFLKKVDIGDRHFSFTEMRLEFPDMEEKGQTE